MAGVRVLDLTRVLAGPFCTMLLGDLGAEVIKIEAPGQGDDTRHWGPPFVESSTPSLPEGGTGTSGSSVRESCYFLSINRNKKSVCVNLKNPKGQQQVSKERRSSRRFRFSAVDPYCCTAMQAGKS